MSFSGEVKSELLKKTEPARHCSIAETAAILWMLGNGQGPGDGNMQLCITSENEPVIRKCFTLLKKTFNIETDVVISESPFTKKGSQYTISITNDGDLQRILRTSKLSVVQDGELALEENSLLIQRECCRRAFIRGAFLASGSMSDPNKGYHFEIVCRTEDKAKQLQDMIRSFHIDAKTVLRKKSHVVYVKEGAQIVDLLAIMGAGIALMDLENIRILKEMRNRVNRKVNCETANINKTVNAAVKQMEDIRLIEERLGFDSLKENLAEIAAIRLRYPEASLKELGLMLNPQVGKSGVNHRLRKLSELAEELRNNEEELL